MFSSATTIAEGSSDAGREQSKPLGGVVGSEPQFNLNMNATSLSILLWTTGFKYFLMGALASEKHIELIFKQQAHTGFCF